MAGENRRQEHQKIIRELLDVTTLYQQMSASGLSDAEVRRKAGEELAAMALRIRRGEEIPEPKNSFRSWAASR